MTTITTSPIATPYTLTPRTRSHIRPAPELIVQRSGGDRSDVIPPLEEFLEFAAQCFIRSGTRLIPFAPLFDYQVAIAKLAMHYRGMVIVKDRQLGITEVLVAWMLCRAKRNPAYAGATFSITEKDAHKVSARVKRMPSRIPEFQWAIDSVGIRQPKDGGELNFRPTTENATRGLESIWDLFLDEAGFPKSDLISEMYASSAPSQEMVGDDARTFIVSTIPPEGRDCWFWQQLDSGTPDSIDIDELLEVARSGGHFNGSAIELPEIPGFCCWEDDGGWIKVIIGHKAHPVYGANPHYVEEQRIKKKLSAEQAEREHNLGLPKSGGSLFNYEAIDSQKIGQWQKPIAGHYYLAGIDPNMGGADEWTLTIWDISVHPIALVAEYHESHRLPSHCRSKSLKLLDQYNVVILAIEKNNGGLSEAEKFILDRPRLRVELVNTSKISKQINTDRISIALNDGDVIFPSDWNGIRQMKKFSKSAREATEGEKDDAVMSWAVGFAYLSEALDYVTRHNSGDAQGESDMSDWEEIEDLF